MPSTYTLNNGIELIGTGEQSGTWGDTTNTNLGLLDVALDGQVTVALASAGSSGSPNSLPISDGTASNGRNRMVVFSDSGDLGATAYVQLTPNDAEKIIYIRNSLSGSRSVILFQGTYNASNDYEVPAGTTAVVYFDGAGAGAVAANVFNNAYFDGLRLGSVSVTAILDEDNMASDSATALATQQSIKAYVDSQVGTVDTLAEILAIGNTTGATDIAVDSAQKVQFRDAAIYINSSVDGQLDIVADTEIQIAATTIDVNGALDVSGTALVTGVLTTTAATVSNGGGQFNGAINVGVDDTGYDVKFFGATTGKSLLWDESADSLIVMLWDESADDLILGGAGGLVVAGNVDFNGDLDVDGTTNLDVVDIDGTLNVAGVSTFTAAINQTTESPSINLTDSSSSRTLSVNVDDNNSFLRASGPMLLQTGGANTAITINASQNSTFAGTVTATGTSVFASLDISGDIDVDGTTNLDVVDIDGATQIDATVTVGVDDTGYDVKFFGATAGAYMLWDESADDLILGGAAGLSVNSAATVGGTLGVTGVVTANAGVVVDTMTLDAATLTATGDFTVDAAGDIVLDAAGSDFLYKYAGSSYLNLKMGSNNVTFESLVSNGDTIFKGNVGGSSTTAMTLDYGDNASVYIANKLKKGFIQPNAAFGQTAATHLNYWKLGRLYVYGPGGAKLVLYGKAGYSTGGSNEGETILLMRGGTSATAIDGLFETRGAAGTSSCTAMGYVPVSGIDYTFDIYAALGNFHSLDHEVVSSGTWETSVSDTGSTSAPAGYVGFTVENTVVLGNVTSHSYNQSSFYINNGAADMDFRVSSDTDTNCFVVNGGTNAVYVGSLAAPVVGTEKFGVSGGTASDSVGIAASVTHNTGTPLFLYNASNTTSNNLIKFATGSGGDTRATITYNGSVVVYATSSDYRLKENINYNFNATEKLKQLKPAEYRWIESQMEDIGFIAHEVAEIVPNAVTGKKDAVDENGKIDPQGYDPAKLVPLLVKTIQELEARITALEA
jgi:hypothetical protein